MRCCSPKSRRIVEEPCRADRPATLTQGVAKPGQSALWTLTDATGDPAAVKRATDFLDAYKSGGLAAPERPWTRLPPPRSAAEGPGTRLTRQPCPPRAAPDHDRSRAPTNQHDVEESTGDSRPDRLRPCRSRHHAARRRRLPRHPRRRRLDRAMPRPRRPQPVAVHRRRCRRAAPPALPRRLRHPRHPRRPRPAARRHVHRLPARTARHRHPPQPRPRLAPPPTRRRTQTQTPPPREDPPLGLPRPPRRHRRPRRALQPRRRRHRRDRRQDVHAARLGRRAPAAQPRRPGYAAVPPAHRPRGRHAGPARLRRRG